MKTTEPTPAKVRALEAYLGHSQTLEACLCNGDIYPSSQERVEMEREKERLWKQYQNTP